MPRDKMILGNGHLCMLSDPLVKFPRGKCSIKHIDGKRCEIDRWTMSCPYTITETDDEGKKVTKIVKLCHILYEIECEANDWDSNTSRCVNIQLKKKGYSRKEIAGMTSGRIARTLNICDARSHKQRFHDHDCNSKLCRGKFYSGKGSIESNPRFLEIEETRRRMNLRNSLNDLKNLLGKKHQFLSYRAIQFFTNRNIKDTSLESSEKSENISNVSEDGKTISKKASFSEEGNVSNQEKVAEQQLIPLEQITKKSSYEKYPFIPHKKRVLQEDSADNQVPFGNIKEEQSYSTDEECFSNDNLEYFDEYEDNDEEQNFPFVEDFEEEEKLSSTMEIPLSDLQNVEELEVEKIPDDSVDGTILKSEDVRLLELRLKEKELEIQNQNLQLREKELEFKRKIFKKLFPDEQ